MSNKLVQVKFISAHRPYNAGEVAAFSPARAEELVNGNVAMYYKPAGEEPVAQERVRLKKDEKQPPDDDKDTDDTDDSDSDDTDDSADTDDAEESVKKPKLMRGKWYLADESGEVEGPYKRKELVKMGYRLPKKD